MSDITPIPNIPADPVEIRAHYRRQRAGGAVPRQALLLARGEATAAGRVDALLPMGVSIGYGSPDYRPVALSPAAVRAAGFDPNHLTARVSAAEDNYDSARCRLSDMGVEVSERRTGMEGQDRPEPYSVAADLSPPRDRPQPVWLTDPYHYDYFLKQRQGYRGAKQYAIGRTREVTEAAAEYASLRLNGTYQDVYLRVEVLWRDEVVGDAAVGFPDMEAGSEWSCGVYDTVCELVDEAFEDAKKWAVGAVADAEREAAAVVRATTLLPDCALRPERFTEDEDANDPPTWAGRAAHPELWVGDVYVGPKE